MELTNELRIVLMSSQYAPIFSPYLSVYDVGHLTVDSANFNAMKEAASAAIPQLLANLHASTALNQFGANGALAASTKPAAKKKPAAKRPMTTGGTPAYCWTHGTTFHSSTACRNKAAGHQDSSTATNKMGGKD